MTLPYDCDICVGRIGKECLTFIDSRRPKDCFAFTTDPVEVWSRLLKQYYYATETGDGLSALGFMRHRRSVDTARNIMFQLRRYKKNVYKEGVLPE